LKSSQYPLSSSLRDLFVQEKIRIPKSLIDFEENEVISLQDFLCLIPSRITIYPKTQEFDCINEAEIFKGFGIIKDFQSRPIFYRKIKSKIMLSNISVTVLDPKSKIEVKLQFFNAYPNLAQKLKNIKELYFVGTATLFKNKFSFVNPSIFNSEEIKNKVCELKYPTIKKVKGKDLERVIKKIPNAFFNSLNEIDYSNKCKNTELIQLSDCYLTLHGRNFNADEEQNQNKLDQAYNRLTYQKFFENNLSLKVKELNRAKLESVNFNNFTPKFYLDLVKDLYDFNLTFEQLKTTKDIFKDFIKPYPMTRLIQGDVGTGKTSVAILASVPIIHNNYQVCYMAPTETLAIQIFKEFQKSFSRVPKLKDNLQIVLLTGSNTKKEKNSIYKNVLSGKISILIGTHSLLNDHLNFNKLGLVIIDEQHKFGIKQRVVLSLKNPNSHCLLMTATPIPKTLSEVLYGNLEISFIKERPRKNNSIKTRIVCEENFLKFLSFLKTRLELKEQVFAVVPRIIGQDDDIINIEKVDAFFKTNYKEYNLGIMHGNLSSKEKIKVFNEFIEGSTQILLATSVIEVGINNPNATVMVIFDANNFGLSSLHQLRGRVARGEKPGFCFLIPSRYDLDDAKINRLKILEESEDGFKIAEEDLKIRGAGDFLGPSQSGHQFANYVEMVENNMGLYESSMSDLSNLQKNDANYFTQLITSIKNNVFLQKSI
jgi:ATP-dependent DNA helicase RecG